MKTKITALVLAAGQSQRMGQPKMLLPWGNMTVLGQVLSTLRAAGLEEILVVTGAEREAVEKIAKNFDARTVHNEGFADGEMLSSLQVGIRALILPPPSLRDTSPGAAPLSGKSDINRLDVNQFPSLGLGGGREAALICLGDQPQAREGTVREALSRFVEGESAIVAPSYNMRRGHPWLVARPLWDEVLAMHAPASPRDFLNAHAAQIEYFAAQTDTIFADLDTVDEYLRFKPADEK